MVSELCVAAVALTAVYIVVDIFLIRPATAKGNEILHWLGDI